MSFAAPRHPKLTRILCFEIRFPDLNAEIAVLLENKADAPAEFVHAKVGVDLRLSPKPVVQFWASNIANVLGTPHAVILHEFQALWGRDRSCPVFNGVLADLGTISITIPPAGGRFLLAWTVQSPRMPPRRGHHLLVYEKTETGARYGFEPVDPSALDSLLQDTRDNENFLREPPQA